MADSEYAPVSVVIPCFRCADTIVRAVASVFAQTWRPREVILVDDHSSDATLERLRLLEGEYPVSWIRVLPLTENGGPGTARNAGWARAGQPYVAFLDADDAWHPKKVEIQLQWMLKHPEVALTGHADRLVTAGEYDGARSVIVDAAPFEKVRSINLLLSNRFPTRSVVLRRDLPHRFMPGKRYSEDFLLWCEICLDGYGCYRSSSTLAYLFKAQFGAGGLSGSLDAMYAGGQDSLLELHKTKRINPVVYHTLRVYFYLKYVRRCAIVWARNVRGKVLGTP